jgi:myosin heavy subunit
MREFLSSLLLTGALLLVVFSESVAHPQTQLTGLKSQPLQPIQQQPTVPSRMDRPLKLSVSVDDESFLQVKEGAVVKKGDIIVDNRWERDRLTQQRKSISLHIQSLKDKPIYKPFEPKAPIPSKPLPPAIFSEEEAAISHAQLRLVQAQSLLEARTALLKGENPEKKALVAKATTALKSVQQKVERQEQMIQSMKEQELQKEIIQHETAKLKQIKEQLELAQSELEFTKAQLQTQNIEQQHQLQQLQIAVQIAQSELNGTKSKLTASQSRRHLLEYDASIEQAKRVQIENQTQQEYSRQQQQYEQAVREKDYQLAQLNISLSTIDDKLSQIPVVRSPRNGYIKKIKPWVGKNGKYTTTITISFVPEN